MGEENLDAFFSDSSHCFRGCCACLSLVPRRRPLRFDLVITNGHIIDGTGSPWYSGDLGIRDGKIALSAILLKPVASVPSMRRGWVVAPGFIDMLARSEETILVDPRLPSKIYQGITTEITGEGGSIAPLNDALIQADKTKYEHLKITPTGAPSGNILGGWRNRGWASTWPATWGTQVRRIVLGDADVQPTAAQLDQMKSLVRECHEGRSRRRLHLSRICSRALCQDGGNHCLGSRGVEVWRNLRDPHCAAKATPS